MWFFSKKEYCMPWVVFSNVSCYYNLKLTMGDVVVLDKVLKIEFNRVDLPMKSSPMIPMLKLYF